MDGRSDLERFIGYVQTFELSQLSDSWDLLLPLFSDDARHITHHAGTLGGDDRGRDAVVSGLRDSVLDHDRRFDVRFGEILAGPRTRGDGIWMRYALTLRRAGLPELRLEGEHVTEYRDGRICRIEEWLAPETPERVARFLAEHGDRLHPAGSKPGLPGARDRHDLEAALARSLVRMYAGAKSEADPGAALSVCGDDFVLETPAFGLRAHGRKAAAAQLEVFFHAFPDYRVELEGMAQGDALAAWGRAELALRGEMLGLPATHATARLPIFCLFDVADGRLARERFVFDRADFCEQLGITAADLAGAVSAVRGDTSSSPSQPAARSPAA